MIQRIQTLFLALVAMGMGGFIAFPIWGKNASTGSQSVVLTATQFIHNTTETSSKITPVWYLAILAALVGLVAIYGIFQYRNRVKQALLCAVNALFMTAITGLVMYFIFLKGNPLFDANLQGETSLGFYSLLLALVANFLANRFIRKDEKFVRSQDRMR